MIKKITVIKTSAPQKIVKAEADLIVDNLDDDFNIIDKNAIKNIILTKDRSFYENNVDSSSTAPSILLLEISYSF